MLRLQFKTLQNKELILLIENNIQGGIPSISGDRYVELDDDNKILFVDSTNVYVWTMKESLLYVEKVFDENVDSDDILQTSYDSSFGNFVECDLKRPDFRKEQKIYLRFALKKTLVLSILIVIL